MINTVVMNIPQWLQGMIEEKRYRNATGMTYEWKIPEPTIHRWLKGERNPGVKYCIQLAELTDTPLEEVVRMAGGEAT